MSFETVADELYGLPLQEFTAARNDRARTARVGGDRDLADRIGALRKPTVAAWLANQLVRQNRDEIDALLALGDQLRTAMASRQGPELRRLTALERELVQGLVRTAQAQASASGQRISDGADQGLTDTLRAALADPAAAQSLSAGRLTEALEPPAFGSLLAGTPSPGTPGGAAPRTPDRSAQGQEGGERGRLERARRDVAEAQDQADGARRAREHAEEALAGARAAVKESAERVERLRGELDEAIDVRNAAERAERDARAGHDRAVRAANEAELHLQATTAAAPDA